MKQPEQTRVQAFSERLHMSLGHLMAASAFAEGNEEWKAHIQEAKSAVCKVLRELETPV